MKDKLAWCAAVHRMQRGEHDLATEQQEAGGEELISHKIFNGYNCIHNKRHLIVPIWSFI